MPFQNTQFAGLCPVCGWRHDVRAFKSRDLVEVIEPELGTPRVPAGSVGLVIQTQLSSMRVDGYLWVRVEFPVMEGCSERHTFYPCELELAADDAEPMLVGRLRTTRRDRQFAAVRALLGIDGDRLEHDVLTHKILDLVESTR